MSQIDRLRELVYVSPSGTEHRPLWDDLTRSGSKKAAIFEIPQSNIAEVQDNGNAARRYAMELYFIGPDCDLFGDAFDAALGERGRAKLKHPRWGDIDVLPFTWSQSENYVDGLRRSSFTVEFVHAPDLSTLTVSDNTAAAIQAAADQAAASAAESAQLEADNATDLARIKSKIVSRVKATNAALQSVASASDDARSALESGARAIEIGIDTLAGTPALLAGSVVALARIPARLDSGIAAKVEGYSGLIVSAAEALGGTPLATAVAGVLDMIANAIAVAEAVTAGTIGNRTEAVSIAERLDAALAIVETAIEYAQSVGYVPDPALLSLLAELRARASAYLLSSAYDLPAERRVVSAEAATPFDLAYKYLGDADRYADLISWNEWGGDMILVVPAGTEWRYYA